MKKGFKYFFIGIGIIALISVAMLGGKILLAPLGVAHTAVDAASNTTKGVINRTLNADNAMDSYRRFHNLYQGMQKHLSNFEIYSKKVNDFEQQMGEIPYPIWSSDDKGEMSHLKTTRDNFKLAFNTAAADYNERAERLDTGMFKGWSLPASVDLIQ